MEYTEINADELENNIFDEIGSKWMLLTAVKKTGEVNTMTASWGCMGVLWNKNVALCFVRPQRYTLEFINDSDIVTFSFLKDGFRDALKLCGTKSGRDTDKITEAGLHVRVENGAALFEESRLTLVTEKLYTGKIEESGFANIALRNENYHKNDFHSFFVCEIKRILKAK